MNPDEEASKRDESWKLSISFVAFSHENSQRKFFFLGCRLQKAAPENSPPQATA